MTGHEEASRAVGVREVALAAGVSRQTVSRVLNDHPSIKPATKERVLAAIAELDYRPNAAARALGTRKSRTIGIIAADQVLYGPATTLAALEAAAREVGYWVSTVYVQSHDLESVDAGILHLREQAVDGIVVIATHEDVLELLRRRDLDIPIVTVHSAGRDEHSLSMDHIAGARLATAHLAELGHTRIAHIAGPRGWLEAQSRSEGFARELADRGLAAGVVIEGDWSARSGHAAASALLADDATAVFVANDQMALGLIRALRERGLDAPGDLSIVGYDDIPDAEYFWPPLTTVRQDFTEIARRSIAVLVSGADPAADAPVPPRLVIRDSTAAPAR